MNSVEIIRGIDLTEITGDYGPQQSPVGSFSGRGMLIEQTGDYPGTVPKTKGVTPLDYA